MNKFQKALSEWLAKEGNTQTGLAADIGRTQVAVRRYALGERFPNAKTARAIEAGTFGDVPFDLWQSDFLERSGILANPRAA